MKQFFSESGRWQSAYARSVFLRYIHQHPQTGRQAFFPVYFQRELKIADGYGYLRGLIRQGLVKKDPELGMVLTEEGRRAVDPEHIRFFDFAGPYVSFAEYAAEKKLLGEEKSFETVMLSLLLKKIKELKTKNDFVSVKNAHLDAATLYERLQLDDQALYHYLVTLYYDVSGLEFYEILNLYVQGRRKRAEAESAFQGVCIQPQVISALRRLNRPCHERTVNEIFDRERISINLCTRADYLALVEELCNGKYDYTAWRGRFTAAYRKILAVADQYRRERQAVEKTMLLK